MSLAYTTQVAPDGRHLVIYPTPGCGVPTVACDCRTPEQATSEAARLNEEQRAKAAAIQRERDLCGLRRIRGNGVV